MSISSEIIRLTPDKARQLIKGQIENRPPSMARVDLYAQEMKAGRWALNGQAIILTKSGKMIDGQHRCLAVVESGVTIETLVVRGVSESHFDLIDQGKSRSVSDVLGGVPNYNRVAAGLRILWREHKGGAISTNIRMTPRDGRELLALHPGVVDSARWVTSSQMKYGVKSGPMVYCHYRAGRIDATARDEFFGRLADGVGLSAMSPILALRAALVSQNGHKLTETHTLALIILAWNYYRMGRHVRFIRYAPNSGQAFPAWEE